MLLKRHYNKPEGWVKEVDEKGNCINPPPLSHIEIKHTGTTPYQNFTVERVAEGIAEGWISIKGDKLTLHGQPEDLVYTIMRVPGRYSCFDGKKLPDDDKGLQARLYIAEHHAGETSPDPEHPAGYENLNYYECVLDEAQHQRCCAQTKGGARG